MNMHVLHDGSGVHSARVRSATRSAWQRLTMDSGSAKVSTFASPHRIPEWAPSRAVQRYTASPSSAPLSTRELRTLLDHPAVLVELLHNVSAEGADLRAALTDENGGTPLYHACMCGKVEAVRVLLRHGWSIGWLDHQMIRSGALPLHVALTCGEMTETETFPCRVDCRTVPPIVEMLLAEGADPNAPMRDHTPPILNVNFDNGNARDVQQRIEQVAASVDATRMLLQAGADPNVPLPIHPGWTPLHFAAAADGGGWVDFSSQLLRFGGRADMPDSAGRTPLLLAVWANHPEMLSAMLGSARSGAFGMHGVEELAGLRAALTATTARPFGSVSSSWWRSPMEIYCHASRVERRGEPPPYARLAGDEPILSVMDGMMREMGLRCP